jgi:hypothetical protein
MPSSDIADDQKRLRQLRSSFRTCRTVPHELECHIGITPADNFHVFAFECRRCHSELLQFLPDAQRKCGEICHAALTAGINRDCHDAIVANALRRIPGPVLCNLQDGDGATMDNNTWIRCDIPKEHGVERVAIGRVRRRHKSPVEGICHAKWKRPGIDIASHFGSYLSFSVEPRGTSTTT